VALDLSSKRRVDKLPICILKGLRMELPKECCSQDALKTLRDDFDFAHAILKHAVHKDLSSFTFSGLRVPAVLRETGAKSAALQVKGIAIEVAIFQDHLHDRITMLAQNRRMLREIWAFNERTRAFREFELVNNEAAAAAIDQTADLVAALYTRTESTVIAALDRVLVRRLDWIDALAPHARAVQEKLGR
jgi:hypothetical protein